MTASSGLQSGEERHEEGNGERVYKPEGIRPPAPDPHACRYADRGTAACNRSINCHIFPIPVCMRHVHTLLDPFLDRHTDPVDLIAGLAILHEDEKDCVPVHVVTTEGS